MTHGFLSLGATWRGCFDQCDEEDSDCESEDLLNPRSVTGYYCELDRVFDSSEPFSFSSVNWNDNSTFHSYCEDLSEVACTILGQPSTWPHSHLIYPASVLSSSWVYNWAFWSWWGSALLIKTYKKVACQSPLLVFPKCFCWEVSLYLLSPEKLFLAMC